MNQKSPAVILALALCAMLFALPHESRAASASQGRLQIKHSPALGLNVPVQVAIDGRYAGVFTKGHIFNRYLSPGRHIIAVSRNGSSFNESRIVLDVRPGQVYSFVAKYCVNEVCLKPSR